MIGEPGIVQFFKANSLENNLIEAIRSWKVNWGQFEEY